MCDSLFIAHLVTTSGPVTFLNALVQVEPTGSIISTDILTFSGLLRNEGVVNVLRLVQPQGTPWWNNSGSITANVVWLWGDSALNTGVIHAVDTLNIGPVTRAANSGRMDGDFLWAGAITNLDTLSFHTAQVDLLLENLAYCRISGLLVGFALLTNESGAYLEADSILLFSGFDNYGLVRVDSLLQLGTDQNPFGEIYYFPSNARIECGNLKNHGRIHGYGDICISDSSINFMYGLIDESPDICDASLATTTAPFIDVNFGTLGSQVNWCDHSSCTTGTPTFTHDRVSLMAFPVPAKSEVRLNVPAVWRVSSIILVDDMGREVQAPFHQLGDQVSIERGDLQGGFFVAFILASDSSVLGRARIVFE